MIPPAGPDCPPGSALAANLGRPACAGAPQARPRLPGPARTAQTRSWARKRDACEAGGGAAAGRLRGGYFWPGPEPIAAWPGRLGGFSVTDGSRVIRVEVLPVTRKPTSYAQALQGQ